MREAHPPEQRIASALQRNVEVSLEFGPGGNPVHDLRCDKIGFNGGNAVSLNAFHFVQRLQQVQKALSCATAEIAGIHTRQHNFLNAFVRNLPGLFHCLAHRDVPASPPGIRYRTVGAEIITTVLYLQKTPGSLSTAIGSKSSSVHVLVSFRGRNCIFIVSVHVFGRIRGWDGRGGTSPQTHAHPRACKRRGPLWGRERRRRFGD